MRSNPPQSYTASTIPCAIDSLTRLIARLGNPVARGKYLRFALGLLAEVAVNIETIWPSCESVLSSTPCSSKELETVNGRLVSI